MIAIRPTWRRIDLSCFGRVTPNLRRRGERQLTSGPAIGKVAAGSEVMAQERTFWTGRRAMMLACSSGWQHRSVSELSEFPRSDEDG